MIISLAQIQEVFIMFGWTFKTQPSFTITIFFRKWFLYLQKGTFPTSYLSNDGSDASFLYGDVDVVQLLAFTPSECSLSNLDRVRIIFDLILDAIRINFLQIK